MAESSGLADERLISQRMWVALELTATILSAAQFAGLILFPIIPGTTVNRTQNVRIALIRSPRFSGSDGSRI